MFLSVFNIPWFAEVFMHTLESRIIGGVGIIGRGGGGGWTLLFGTREYLRSIASLFLVNEISREDWTRKLKKGYSKDTWENTKYFFFARFLSFSPYCSHFLSLSLYLSLSGTINPKMTKINPPLLHSLHLFNFGSPASFFHLRVSQVIHLL